MWLISGVIFGVRDDDWQIGSRVFLAPRGEPIFAQNFPPPQSTDQMLAQVLSMSSQFTDVGSVHVRILTVLRAYANIRYSHVANSDLLMLFLMGYP